MLYYTIPYHTITYLVARANIQLAATEKEGESERDIKRYTEDNKLTRSNGIDKENKSDNSLSLSFSRCAAFVSRHSLYRVGKQLEKTQNDFYLIFTPVFRANKFRILCLI